MTQIIRDQRKKNVTLGRQFLVIFIPFVLFLTCVALLFSYHDINSSLQTLKRIEREKISAQQSLMSAKLRSITTTLKILALAPETSAFLRTSSLDLQQKVTKQLLLFCQMKEVFTQAALIDATGRERIFIRKENNTFMVLPVHQLEKISDSTCVTSIIARIHDGIYTSPFQCNPFNEAKQNPALHFSMPVQDDHGTSLGYIDLTLPMGNILEDLRTASMNAPGETILVSQSGQFLGTTGTDIQAPFAAISIINDLKKQTAHLSETVFSNLEGQLLTDSGLLTFTTLFSQNNDQSSFLSSSNGVFPEKNFIWQSISCVPPSDLHLMQKETLESIVFFYLLALLLVALGSVTLAGTKVRRTIAEQNMSEKSDELRAINEAAASAIIAIDDSHCIQHWNPAAEQIFHYTSKEIEGRPIQLILSPPPHAAAHEKNSDDSFPTIALNETSTMVISGYRKDGNRFPLEASFSSFMKNDRLFTVGICQDISERRAMERERLRANKFESLSVLSAGIAHDFNDLLTAIIGSLSIVLKTAETPAEAMYLLKEGEIAARRAKGLTQQLLTFSKEGMLIRQTTSIAGVLQEAVDDALHGSTRITSAIIVPDDLFLVNIDQGQVTQIIKNIVLNASQSIPGTGAVNIICRNILSAADCELLPEKYSGQYIEIAIHDTGTGIPEHLKQKIYDPYFTTKDHSSGLGLTIAKAIIARHDGYITNFSRENSGTTFYLYLPAAVDQHLPAEQSMILQQHRQYRVLLVDDEDMLLMVTEKMLTHLGHECIQAKSSHEALDTYRRLWKTGTPVDVVIIDLTLSGGLGGKETAQALLDTNAEAKIIVSSGFTNDPVMVNYDEYGFSAAIGKPFDMDELERTISSVFS